jgi:fibronectin-binding autotransporter adhesin
MNSPILARRLHRALLASLLLLAVFISPGLHAATYYWDTNDSTAGFGTAGGTWAAPTTNNSTQGWSTSATGVNAMSGTTTTTTGDALNFGTSTNGLAAGTITVSGDVSSANITFGNASGNITLSGGNITLNGNILSSAASAGKAHTITSNITLSGGSRTFGNNANQRFIFNGVISGSSNLVADTQNNGGAITLNGTNTFTGNFQITRGQVNFNSLADAGQNSALGAGSVITSGGGGGQQPFWWYTGASSASSNRSWNLQGSTSTIAAQDGSLLLSGNFNNVSSFNAALTLVGTADTGTNEISGNIFNGNNSSYTTSITVASSAPQGGSTEAGFWILSGNNSYNGTTSVQNSSILRIAHSNALGSTVGSTTVATGSVLELTGGISVGAEALSLSGTGNSSGGALRNISGSNSYAGVITLGAATRINSDAGTITLSGDIAGTQNLTIGGAGDTTVSGNITTSTGTLTKDGAGTLTISSSGNTYSGATTVSAGTLAVSGSLTSSAVSMTGGDVTIGGTVSTLTASSSGNLSVSGTATSVTMASGADVNVTGTLGGLTFDSGGNMSVGTTGAVGTVGTSSITINGGGYKWTMSSANGSAGTAYDQITSTGGLTSSGQLTIYAYGTPGDWDGSASYDWDIFNANSASGFSAGNFTLNLDNFGIAAGNRTGTWAFSNPSGGVIRLSYAPSGDPVWTGGTGNFSTGFTPSASNGDDIAFSGAGGTATNDSLTSVNDLVFRSGAGAYTIAGTALTVNGTIYNNSTTTQIFSTAPTGDNTYNANSGNITVSGVVSGNITKTGSSTLTLSASNTYTGTTAVNAGILAITNLNALGSNATGTVIADGAALHKNVGGDFYEPLTITGNGTGSGAFYSTVASNALYGTITLAGNATIGGTQRYDMNAGGITDGAGSYTLTYEGSSNFYHWGGGATYEKLVVNSGTWGTNSGANLPGTIEVNSGASLTSWGYSGANGGNITFNSGTFNPAAGSNNSQTWDQNMVLNGTVSFALGTNGADKSVEAILSGVISGSGNISMSRNIGSTMEFVFTGNNTYTGNTTIGAGVTFSIEGSGVLGAGSYAGNIVNSGVGFTYNSTANQTISGTVSGTGALVKDSTSTLTLSGGKSYSGATTINGGTLVLSDASNVTLDTANITINNGASLAFNNSGAYTYQSKTITFGSSGGGNISSTGTLKMNGTTISTTGGSTNYFNGTLVDLSTPIFDVADGTDDVDLEVGFSFNRGGFTKNGAGKLLLTNASNNLQTNAITINAGLLEIGATGRLLNGSYAGNITNGGTFIYSGTSAQTLSGIISGSGALTQNAASTLTLSNASNSYTGATTINAGTISISAVGALGSTSGVNLGNGTELTYTGAAATLSRNITVTVGNATVSNTGSGLLTLSGAISKNGTTLVLDGGAQGIDVTGVISGSAANSDLVVEGNVTLSAANTYNGPTTITAGSNLTANVTNAMGNTTSVVMHNGGSLLVRANDSINDTASMTMNGSTLKFDGNITEWVGALTLSANSTIDMGGGNIALHFSDLVAGLTAVTRLNIYNYTLYSDHLYFTNNANVSDSLPYISFYSGWGTGLIGNSFISSLSSPWQVQPVPEPETWATAAILLIGSGIYLLRRKKQAA